MTHILSIETTCDETAAAITNERLEVLGSVVASQEQLHQKYQGIVPELAARAHVERILPVIETTLERASLPVSALDAIAVATTPGLAGSLMIGLTAAKTLALALQKPLIAINHLHAHVYACRIAAQTEVFPCVGFVISGGHTHLYRCDNPLSFTLIGGTIDDAAGEAFDKVASMLGLPFPGGPSVSRLAEQGDPRKYRFPRSYIREPEQMKFSFSGLKTAVRYAMTGPGPQDFKNLKLSEKQRADIAASFQQAVVDTLVAKSIQAVKQSGLSRLCVGGGVAANSLLRSQLSQAADEAGIELFIAPPNLCTDNAVMGAIAHEHYRAKAFESLELDIAPGLIRES